MARLARSVGIKLTACETSSERSGRVRRFGSDNEPWLQFQHGLAGLAGGGARPPEVHGKARLVWSGQRGALLIFVDSWGEARCIHRKAAVDKAFDAMAKEPLMQLEPQI